MIVGITRIRNEALIIEDTITQALTHADRVVVYDDFSTDDTAEIVASFPDTVELIRGTEWLTDRPSEETRHRALLLRRAVQLGADWVWCFDADERLVGNLPDLTGPAVAYQFRLFDGYLTEECQAAYSGGDLADLERMWGPEFRDIIMLFRPEFAEYRGFDKRQPKITGRVDRAQTLIKHFGKCLSVEHWEETCDYYSMWWPVRYREKWLARKGKAIHTKSDFGRSLYPWSEVVENGVPL